jgi:hypothetical protein
MASIKSINLLPEIFRSDTNKKFLAATVDQLISEPGLKKIDGFVGRKFAPTFKYNDSYIEEPTQDRQNYQLEASFVVQDQNKNVEFYSSYIDLIQKINYYSGLTNDHSRLFENESYNFNGLFDFDKFVNFNQYYWLPDGPPEVAVSASAITEVLNFSVLRDTKQTAYTFSNDARDPNPVLTLIKGNTYRFTLNQPGNGFWIQTEPGKTGTRSTEAEALSREVFGVENNGEDSGVVVFSVPASTAQDDERFASRIATVNYATDLPYARVQNHLLTIIKQAGGIDGATARSLNGSTLIFLSRSDNDTDWTDKGTFDFDRYDQGSPYVDGTYEQGDLLEASKRYDIFRIRITNVGTNNGLVQLEHLQSVNTNEKVYVSGGTNNAGVEFIKNAEGYWERVKQITSPLTELYYQDANSDSYSGVIKLIEPTDARLDVEGVILGRKNYTSPNGVRFTNGLKIRFDSTAFPSEYANSVYIVEGVGKSIRLVGTGNLTVPEDYALNDNLATPDYITVSRGSKDLNAWSRSNRWFHSELIELAAQYNNDPNLLLDTPVRAVRPIIEFESDLYLFNYGQRSKAPVDVLDYTITDAFKEVEGKETYVITLPNNVSRPLTDGTRIIFAADKNPEVRNKIFKVTFISIADRTQIHLVSENTELLPTYTVSSTQIIEDTTVAFIGGNPDFPATATLIVDPVTGEIQDLVFSNVGVNYRSIPEVGFVGGGAGVGAEITVTVENGSISDYQIVSRGIDYSVAPLYDFVPTVTFSRPVPSIGAVQATGTAVMEPTSVDNITVGYRGLNFVADPYVKIDTPNTQDARIDPVYSAYKHVDYVRITSSGSGIGTIATANIGSPNSLEKLTVYANAATFTSNIIVLDNTTGLAAGQLIYGSGITGGTVINNVLGANSILISSPASLSNDVQLVFKASEATAVTLRAVYGNSAVFSTQLLSLNSVTGLATGYKIYGDGVPVDATVDDIFGNLVVKISDLVQVQNNRNFIFKPAGVQTATVVATSRNSTTVTVDNSNVAGIDMYITGGALPLDIANIEIDNPVILTTTDAHNLIDGDEITIRGVLGTVEMNNNTYWVEIVDPFTLRLYADEARSVTLDGRNYTTYISGGVAAAFTIESDIKVVQLLDENRVVLSRPVSVKVGTTVAFVGRRAQATVYTDGSEAYAIAVTDPGAGYTSVPSITISPSGISEATATVVLNNDVLEYFKVVSAGSGYQINQDLTTSIITSATLTTASTTSYQSNTLIVTNIPEATYVKEDWLVFLVVEENENISYRDFSRVPYVSTDITGPNSNLYQYYMDVALTQANILKVTGVQEVLDSNLETQYEITLDGIIDSLDSDGEPIDLPAGTKIFITAKNRFFVEGFFGDNNPIGDVKSNYFIKQPVNNTSLVVLEDVTGLQKGMLINDLADSLGEGLIIETVNAVSNEITLNRRINAAAGLALQASTATAATVNLNPSKIQAIAVDNIGAEYTSAPLITVEPAVPSVVKLASSFGTDRLLVSDLDGIIVGMTVTSEYNTSGNGVTTGSIVPKVIGVDTIQIGAAVFEYYVILNQVQPEFAGLLVTFNYATKAIALIADARSRVVNTNDVTPDTYESDDTVIVSLPTTGQNAIKQKQIGVNVYNQYWYTGEEWVPAQQKTSYNQSPLFDLFNDDGVSISDTAAFLGSKFEGTKIFSYLEGTGQRDAALGFSLSYKNFQNVGDIVFANNYDTDSFAFIENKLSTSLPLNQFLFKQKTDSGFVYRNIWKKTAEKTKQYQIITKFFDGNTNYFQIDIDPNASETIPYLKVYVDNRLLAESSYTVTKYEQLDVIVIDESELSFDPPSKVDILIFSSSVSELGYYQLPLNIDLNTENKNFNTLTLGQLRQHLVAMSQNNYGLSGNILAKNNLRDLEIKDWTGCILQHASPAMYSGLAFGDQGFEFVEAIEYAQKEYTKFKNKFLDQALKVEINVSNIPEAVDKVMEVVNLGKNTTMPWYDSDMIPYGKAFTNSRIPVVDIRQLRYQIPSLYNDTVPSRRSVLVYLGDTATGTYVQLAKNKDFTFNQTIAAIDLSETVSLTYTSYIELIDRPSTVGSYVPETPSKLGLYPSYVPRMFVDDSYQTPRQVIQGHDGSIMPAFGDYRDDLLLELELRIYNNIKVRYTNTILDIVDSIPGKFRKINYSLAEFNQLLSRNFLRWVGINSVNYSTNDTFQSNNAWTWNYKFLKDSNGEFLPGFWRGIYFYYFDTDRPHLAPWEMLGFYEQPSWWEDRYGPAPYTGTNTVLWDDLELGFIAQGTRQGVDSRFARPGLSRYIPVDEYGQLKSPEKFAPASFDATRLSSGWAIGDQGPVETAWRRSSEYPYALQVAIALSRPAFYFGSLMNTVGYLRNSNIDQLVLSDTKQRINKDNFVIPDDGLNSGVVTLTAGYINWVRDWFTNKAIDGTAKITSLVRNLEVKLSYKMAGYSDNNFLTVVADQSSPVSRASSIILPPENYKIFLNKSAPVEKISYSAVVIERTATGFAVRGYDLEQPYFTIIPSKRNNNAFSISAIEETAIIYRDFEFTKVIVPYGFEFATKQQVVDFLISYGRYLTAQGLVFDTFNADLETKQTWILSAQEFLVWSQQGWASGNLLVLSPVFNSIKIINTAGVVDHVVNSISASKILDQNFNIIKNSQFSVLRDDNVFQITSVFGHTIGLAVFNLVQYEHVLLMDNNTVFGDIIYQPELGNRQYRLRLIGNKTNNWTGQLNPGGFIYNNDIIDEWQPGRNYRKSALVSFKEKFYFAISEVPASVEFDFTYWSNIDKSKIKTGLLPNFSYNAEKFNNVYNIDDTVADAALDSLSSGITGFRERSYFQDFKLDNVSQTKFYQGYIKQKGSINAIDALTTARFNNLFSNIELYEEWALRVGDYGALGSDQAVEFQLLEQDLKNNPSTLVLKNKTDPDQEGLINVEIGQLYYAPDNFIDKNVISLRQDVKTRVSDAVTAGYPRLDDVDATIFDITDYASYADLVNIIGAGFKIWVARDFNKDWNVYRVNETDVLINQFQIGLDNRITVTTNVPHGLVAGTVIIVKNFDTDYNGFYQVIAVTNNDQFVVEGYQNLQRLRSQQFVDGTGVLLSLTSVRFSRINQLVNFVPRHGWRDKDKIWVDNDVGDKLWAVFEKNAGWSFDKILPLREGEAQSQQGYGEAIAINNDQKIVISGAKDYSDGGVSGLRVLNPGFLYDVPEATFSSPDLENGKTVTATLDTESGTLLTARLTAAGSDYDLLPNIEIVDFNLAVTSANTYQSNTIPISSLSVSVTKLVYSDVVDSKSVILANSNDIWVGDTVTGSDGAGNTVAAAIVANINYSSNTITLTDSITWSIVNSQSLTFTHSRVFLNDIVTGTDATGNVIPENTKITAINTLTNTVETGPILINFDGGSTLSFSRGTGGNVQARLSPTFISSVEVINGGSGFVTPPIVEIVGGGGTGAQIIVNLVTTGAGTGSISSCTILNPGTGFTLPPEINLITTNANHGAILRVKLAPSGVENLVVAAAGQDYRFPRLQFSTVSGGAGSGAAGNVNVTNGSVTIARLREFGQGYSDTPTVIITDSVGNGAGCELEIVRTTGAVRTFQLEEGSFTQVQNLSAFGLDAEEFGFTLDLGSAYGFVGAPGSFNQQGAVLISKSTGSNWISQQVLNPADLENNDRFGHALVVSDDENWLYVGAPGANKVYVYTAKTTSTNQQKIEIITNQISYITNYVLVKTSAEVKVVGDSGKLYEPDFDYTVIAGVLTFRNFGTIENEKFLYLSQIYPTTAITPTVIRGILQTSYVLATTPVEIEQINVVGATGRIFIPDLDYTLTGVTLNFLNDDFATEASLAVNVLTKYYILVTTLEPTDQVIWEDGVQFNSVARQLLAATVNTYGAMVAGSYQVGDIIKVLNTDGASAGSYQLYKKLAGGAFALQGTENRKVTRGVAKFGWSLAIDKEGYQVVVGAPQAGATDNDTDIIRVGKIYIFDREYQVFVGSVATNTNTYKTLRDIVGVTKITIDGFELVQGIDYQVGSIGQSGISNIVLIDGGANYVSAPTVVISGGGGTGATASASIDVTTGKVTGIVVNNAGSGYTSVPTVVLSGGGPVDPEDVATAYVVLPEQTAITFTTAPQSGAKIKVDVNQFGLIQKIENPDIVKDSYFGQSVAIDQSRKNIFVGAPGYRDIDYYNGKVYRFVNRPLAFGKEIGDNASITVLQGDYIRINDIPVVFQESDGNSEKVVKDINNRNITGLFARTDGVSNLEFLSDLGIPLRGSGYFESNVSIVIGDPDQIEDAVTATVGNITLFANGAINGFEITNRGSGYTFAPTVTITGANTVLARMSSTIGASQITVLANATAKSNSINILPGAGTALQDIGFSIYTPVQEFTHPDLGAPERFGTLIKLDNATGETLLVSSEGGVTLKKSTFDNQATVFDKDTTRFIDLLKNSGAVYIYDYLPIPNETINSPSQYLYNQVLQNSNIFFDDNFGSGIEIRNNWIIVGATKSDYYNENAGLLHLFVNANNQKGWSKLRSRTDKVDIDYINQGFLYNRKSQTIVTDLDYFDPVKGKILGIADQDLDYKTIYDPAVYNRGNGTTQTFDENSVWNDLQVGKTWWNLDKCRYIDYEQGDLSYRTTFWGELFPGSEVEVCEWVDSYVLPSEYQTLIGNGEALYADDSAYVEFNFLDNQSGLIRTKYYYWVKNKITVDTVRTKRTNSVASLAKIIADPKSQNLPYFAVVAANAFSLYNVNRYLLADEIIFKIDYGITVNENIAHSEYELVQQGNALSPIPEKYINKLIDSLAGENIVGEVIPDLSLRESTRYGVSLRPRQSMIKDTIKATEVFVNYVNRFLKDQLIVKYKDLSILKNAEPIPPDAAGFYNLIVDTKDELLYIQTEELQAGYKVLVRSDSDYEAYWTIYEYTPDSDYDIWSLIRIQSYDSSRYWYYDNWYASGYNETTTIDYIVPEFKDTVTLTLVPGNVIKVLDDGNGQFELYVTNADLSLTVIGVENGTIQISAALYDYDLSLVGFDNAPFDTVGFAKTIALELRNIVQGLIAGIFTDTDIIQINKLFFTLINYILSEQRSLDWLIKTSLVSVVHKIRKLETFSSYIRDEQDYFENYINEVKPYRTQLRNYLLDYEGLDTVNANATDFDLPSIYDVDQQKYRTLDINSSTDANLIANSYAVNWSTNYKYVLESVIVVSPGEGYVRAPSVFITGGGGTGATAVATIDNSTGQVIEIDLVNRGTGYTSQPIVTIEGGGGFGARAYTVLSSIGGDVSSSTVNKTVRNIKTLISFDRVTYASQVIKWKPYTTYHTDDIVVVPDVTSVFFNNLPDQSLPRYNYAYKILKTVLGSGTLDLNLFNDSSVVQKLSGVDIDNAIDRIAVYNQPGSPDIATLYSSPDSQRLDASNTNEAAISQNNEWNKVLHSGGVAYLHEYQYLAIGNRSLLAVSQTGETWTYVPVRENDIDLRDGCFFDGNVWIAVGNQGSLLTSTNALTWTKEQVTEFKFSPDANNPEGAVQQNANQVVDFVGVVAVSTTRSNYVIAVGNGNSILVNPYDTSDDVAQGWYSAKPQPNIFASPRQLLTVHAVDFGTLTDNNGTQYTVDLQSSGYFTSGTQSLMKQGFVIIGGVNGNMFITSYNRLDDLIQGYAKSYNYDSGKLTDQSYPWISMAVPAEIRGQGDGTSGEQINGIAVSTTFDRYIVAVGSAGTLLWNRIDSPLEVQNGTADLASDTIGKTVVDHGIYVYKNFRYFNADNFVSPLTPSALEKIDFTDIAWDNEKFVVTGTGSTTIWGYPGSQSEAYIELGNINPILSAETRSGSSTETLARWDAVVSATSVEIVINGSALIGWIIPGMTVTSTHLPTDSVVTAASYDAGTDEWTVDVAFASTSFISRTGQNISFAYVFTENIPVGTTLTFTGPNNETKTLVTSRAVLRGENTVYVTGFDKVAANWAISGTGIPVGARIKQIGRFPAFTWQYAEGSGRNLNIDYNSISVNTTTVQINQPFTANIPAGSLITLFDTTGLKSQYVAAQALPKNSRTLVFANAVAITTGFTLEANTTLGIQGGTSVIGAKLYTIGGVLNHLAKDIPDLIPGTSYSGVKVLGQPFTETGSDILSLDTTISSEYVDTNLGTRPEDIVINGGQFIDTYSSHAPQELVPGQVIDSLQMNVFTANVVNGNVDYGNVIAYKIFTDYKKPTVYYRLSQANTTVLASSLSYDDTEIIVDDVTKLPEPNAVLNQPGSIWINAERINYFGRDVGRNAITDIRRGASRTSIPLTHEAGSLISDASQAQEITRDTVLTILSDLTVNNGFDGTANSVTYQTSISNQVPQSSIWLEPGT